IEDAVVPRLIRLLQCNQRRPDENKHAVAVDLDRSRRWQRCVGRSWRSGEIRREGGTNKSRDQRTSDQLSVKLTPPPTPKSPWKLPAPAAFKRTRPFGIVKPIPAAPPPSLINSPIPPPIDNLPGRSSYRIWPLAMASATPPRASFCT